MASFTDPTTSSVQTITPSIPAESVDGRTIICLTTQLVYTIEDKKMTNLQCSYWQDCPSGCKNCLPGIFWGSTPDFEVRSLECSAIQHGTQFWHDLSKYTNKLIFRLRDQEVERRCSRPRTDGHDPAYDFHRLAVISCRAANQGLDSMFPTYIAGHEDLTRRSICVTRVVDSSAPTEKEHVFVSWQDHDAKTDTATWKYFDKASMGEGAKQELRSGILPGFPLP